MKNQSIKLSIIMPCYNVANTLNRAISSILMQKVNFSFEVIIIDDGSTDNTLSIAKKYAEKDSRFVILENKNNEGNARSFYLGLRRSLGDYFCVLDGDDYYTVRDKLQKQVDFFEKDTDSQYVASCHCFILDFENGLVNAPRRGMQDEFNYIDMITENVGAYYHTSSYMYRNIFNGMDPTFFSYDHFRGDTPRTIFHLLYSNKKVKVLNFVGSAYFYDNQGIWSKLTQKKQVLRQITFLQNLVDAVNTDFEKQSIEKTINKWKSLLELPTDSRRQYHKKDLNAVLERVRDIAKYYAFKQKNYVLKSLFYSEYLDSLCDTVGEIYRLQNPECIQTSCIDKHISIVIGTVGLCGGGIIKEIEELFIIYSDFNIQVLVTNMSMENIPIELFALWDKYSNVTIKCPSKECDDRLGYYYQEQKNFAPSKTYFYCSHDDPWGIALMQPGKGQNVSLFSFDHGFILGLSSSNLETIIAKRPMDYTLLYKKFGDKIKYLPTWHVPTYIGNLRYKPFNNHKNLITATCAARHYKIDGAEPYRYFDYIVDLLKVCQGKHFHIGPLLDSMKLEMKTKLEDAGISPNQFVQIDWVDNLSKFFLENNIDVFISPFPVVTYKTTLELLCHGVPTIHFSGLTRIQNIDFIYNNSLKYSSKEEFVSILSSVSAKELQKHSDLSKTYFHKNHNFEIISSLLRNGDYYKAPLQSLVFADNSLQEIKEYTHLLGAEVNAHIMKPEEEAAKLEAELKKQEAAKLEAERKKQEAAKLEAELKKQEAAKLEAERKKQEAAKLEAERKKQEAAKLEAERKKQEEEKKYRLEIARIRNSKSYKLGFFLLWPLRYFKAVLKNLPSMKFKAFREMAKKEALHPRRASLKEEMIAYQNCASWKFGRFITSPYRGLKNIFTMIFKPRRKRYNSKQYLKEILSTTDYLKAETYKSNKEYMQIQAQNKHLTNTVIDESEKLAHNIHRIVSYYIKQNNIIIENFSESKKELTYYIASLQSLLGSEIDTLKGDNQKAIAGIKKSLHEQKNMLETTPEKMQKLFNNELKILQEDNKKHPRTFLKNFIEHLDISITTHCNLNCKGCNSFAPLARETYANVDKFRADLTKLHSLVGDTVIQIHLLGGEPLLHPNAKEFAIVAREVFKEARIDFTTNGLLVKSMPDDFWETLRLNSIALKYTRYPINLDYNEMLEYVQSKGIYVFSASGGKAIESFKKIPMNISGTNSVNKSYEKCPYTACTQLLDGKLFHCPASAFSFKLNNHMQKEGKTERFKVVKNDYIDLYEVKSKEEIFEFIQHPIPFCRYCNILAIKNIPWSISNGTLDEWIE